MLLSASGGTSYILVDWCQPKFADSTVFSESSDKLPHPFFKILRTSLFFLNLQLHHLLSLSSGDLAFIFMRKREAIKVE